MVKTKIAKVDTIVSIDTIYGKFLFLILLHV